MGCEEGVKKEKHKWNVDAPSFEPKKIWCVCLDLVYKMGMDCGGCHTTGGYRNVSMIEDVYRCVRRINDCTDLYRMQRESWYMHRCSLWGL
jgi:hypothetical protein